MEGKPHCQNCYLNTLERCCKCFQPILDRILRATGKITNQLNGEEYSLFSLQASRTIPTASLAWSAPRALMGSPSLWTLLIRFTALRSDHQRIYKDKYLTHTNFRIFTGGSLPDAPCVAIPLCPPRARRRLSGV